MKKYMLWIAAFLAMACHKTDKYAQLVNNQPFLVTGELGLFSIGLGIYPGYQTSYLVGDTAIFVGKFFLDRPGSRIQVGKDTPRIVTHLFLPNGTNEYTHGTNELDVIRFVITDTMGLGNNIPVSLTANGVTIQAPPLSIRAFKGIMRRTDTTLYVDSVTRWVPPDLAFYQSRYLNLINQTCVSGDGTIWFNNLTGIYAVRSGQVQPFMKVGDPFQEKGVAFTINMIMGSVISFMGDSLIFSAEVKENNPDTASYYIYRLCKMDLATKTVTTLNRSKVLRATVAVDQQAGPFEGSIGQLSVVAIDLKTDANGAIYFVNNFLPARSDVYPVYWYGDGTTPALFYGDGHILENFCRMDAGGQVKSLFSNHSPFFGPPLYTIPGYPLAQTSDVLIGLDGSTGYGADQQNLLGAVSLAYMDLRQDAPLMSTGVNSSTYRFFSYDTSLVTGIHSPIWNMSFMFNYNSPGQNYLNNYMILPDGDLLFNYTGSLGALDLQNGTVYCYAGTEIGLGSPPAAQNKTTGKAKWVGFWSVSFAGIDKQAGIYYYTGGQDYVNGVQFFKLYSKH